MVQIEQIECANVGEHGGIVNADHIEHIHGQLGIGQSTNEDWHRHGAGEG